MRPGSVGCSTNMNWLRDPSKCTLQPGRASFELLGRKWTALIVWALGRGPRRFSELMDDFHGVSDRMFARRLKELEAADIVTRTQHPEIPPRVEYTLTRKGGALRPVIEAMERWSSKWESAGKRPSIVESAGLAAPWRPHSRRPIIHRRVAQSDSSPERAARSPRVRLRRAVSRPSTPPRA
jgi:DNA-binding HxlR family transcriptional regulator